MTRTAYGQPRLPGCPAKKSSDTFVHAVARSLAAATHFCLAAPVQLLALSHHSGARVFGAGGAERPFSFSLGIVSPRWSLALGRAEAYQHMVPS